MWRSPQFAGWRPTYLFGSEIKRPGQKAMRSDIATVAAHQWF